jgi:hypothetical protein
MRLKESDRDAGTIIPGNFRGTIQDEENSGSNVVLKSD